MKFYKKYGPIKYGNIYFSDNLMSEEVQHFQNNLMAKNETQNKLSMLLYLPQDSIPSMILEEKEYGTQNR